MPCLRNGVSTSRRPKKGIEFEERCVGLWRRWLGRRCEQGRCDAMARFPARGRVVRLNLAGDPADAVNRVIKAMDAGDITPAEAKDALDVLNHNCVSRITPGRSVLLLSFTVSSPHSTRPAVPLQSCRRAFRCLESNFHLPQCSNASRRLATR